jgi:hypothetical protein
MYIFSHKHKNQMFLKMIALKMWLQRQVCICECQTRDDFCFQVGKMRIDLEQTTGIPRNSQVI